MTDLEMLAKKFFEEYCYKKTGKKLNWDLLSLERQQAWMDEILNVAEFIGKEISSVIKPNPPLGARNTSYNQGYNDGINTERVNLINLLYKINNNLRLDLQEFIKEIAE